MDLEGKMTQQILPNTKPHHAVNNVTLINTYLSTGLTAGLLSVVDGSIVNTILKIILHSGHNRMTPLNNYIKSLSSYIEQRS